MPRKPKESAHYIPCPGKKEVKLPIIPPPFFIHTMNDDVFRGGLGKSDLNNRQRVTARAQQRLSTSNITRVKYLYRLFEIGAAIDNAIHTLQTTQTLDISQIRDHVVLSSHVVFRMEHKMSNIPKKGHKLTQDKDLIMWETILTDLKMLLHMHVEDFILACSLSSLPDYSAFPSLRPPV